MVAQLLDGKAIAEGILAELKAEVAELRQAGCIPTLASVQVGDDPTNSVYVRQQQKQCARLGIEYLATQMPDRSSEHAVRTMVASLNANPTVHGIILQMPLPRNFDAERIQTAVRPEKDVEGMHPENVGNLVYGRTGLVPCTAMATLELIRATGVSLRGMDVAVVGAGPVAGKPLSILLLNELATVTVCHIETRDVAFHTTRAEILIVAVGRPGLIKGSMVKPGAIVVDVGINTIDKMDAAGRPVLNKRGERAKTVVGDVDGEEVAKVAGYLTPVPGGVGPVTVAMLMKNIVRAARQACAS